MSRHRKRYLLGHRVWWFDLLYTLIVGVNLLVVGQNLLSGTWYLAPISLICAGFCIRIWKKLRQSISQHEQTMAKLDKEIHDLKAKLFAEIPDSQIDYIFLTLIEDF